MRKATTKEIITKLGTPKQTTSNLVRLNLPYTMKLAWALQTKINSILVHPAIKKNLENVLRCVKADYTVDQIEKLGLNLYGGCYNYRAMRGGSDWSRHSWAIAIDFDPERNQLTWGAKEALIDNEEYKCFRDAMRANGFISLGELSNYDWMHFEASFELLYGLKY
jgi:hypothetical protein